MPQLVSQKVSAIVLLAGVENHFTYETDTGKFIINLSFTKSPQLEHVEMQNSWQLFDSDWQVSFLTPCKLLDTFDALQFTWCQKRHLPI